jgi:2,4-dienoyl-CoA reductase-like NADH-dependent reductase (Old Yellow Enzyme family)
MSKDPLLQSYLLKHLTLRNRIMKTSHEPAKPLTATLRGYLAFTVLATW